MWSQTNSFEAETIGRHKSGIVGWPLSIMGIHFDPFFFFCQGNYSFAINPLLLKVLSTPPPQLPTDTLENFSSLGFDSEMKAL